MQGNRSCDICKTVVKNLPEVQPQLPDSATTQNGFDENGEMLRSNALILAEQTPSGADVVFDCIRVSLSTAHVGDSIFPLPRSVGSAAIFTIYNTAIAPSLFCCWRHDTKFLLEAQSS